jgi:response regulator RpfG family c-di-GMP phosphodiesterase
MEPFKENRRILFVDDEKQILYSFQSLMRKENVEIMTLSESAGIEELLQKEIDFALVLSDQRMPGIDGVTVLEKIKEKSPETIRVLVTGYADYKDTIRAINISGISSYISKPWDDDQLKKQINGWLSQYNLKQHNNYLMKILDEENYKLNELLEGTVAQTVRVLGDLSKHISPQISEFGDKVKTLGISVLKVMPEMAVSDKWQIFRALDLFNIGVALLPLWLQTSIANNGLSAIDNSPIAKNHHLLAAGLINNIPGLETVARIIELQAKNFNGSGEPVSEKISGTDIPFGARLLHILIHIVRPSTDLRGRDLLNHMRRIPGMFDPNIIDLLLGKNINLEFIFEDFYFKVDGLKPGMMTSEDIRTLSGHLLLKTNTILNETFINIILQWHLRDPISEPIKVKKIAAS